MTSIYHIPKIIMRLLLVLGIVISIYQIILPRTSFNFRYRLYYPKFGKYLTSQELVLLRGESAFLKVKTINQRLSFTSTDYKVAYADRLGRVTAYKPGKAYIKVKVQEKTLVCRVFVIDLNYDKLSLSVGESKRLNVLGNWLFEKYESSDSSIAAVNAFGKVTGVRKGTTTILATAKGRKMTCKVTVE